MTDPQKTWIREQTRSLIQSVQPLTRHEMAELAGIMCEEWEALLPKDGGAETWRDRAISDPML